MSCNAIQCTFQCVSMHFKAFQWISKGLSGVLGDFTGSLMSSKIVSGDFRRASRRYRAFFYVTRVLGCELQRDFRELQSH